MVKTTAVAMFTCAPQGAGKTYRRGAHFVFTEWLRERDGVHYSSFPFRFDPYLDPVTGEERKGLVREAAETYAMAEDEVRRRVQVFPEAVKKMWATGDSGPWDYFQEIYEERCREVGADPDDEDNGVEHPLQGAHVAIDEAHVYYPNKAKGAHRAAIKRCMEWLAEIRHQGATVEFISQYEYQIAPDVRNLCQAFVQLTNLENDREPFLGCMMGDWWQVWAKFVTGKYRSYVREELFTQDGRRKTKKESGVYQLEPRYFALYDSYSKPSKGGKAGKRAGREWERKGVLQFLLWFFWRNAFTLITRFAVFGLVFWFCFMGGAGHAIRFASARLQRAITGDIEPAPRADVESVHAVPEASLGDEGRAAEELAYMTRLYNDVRAERDELAARLGDAGTLVMVTFEGVTFRNGDHYRIGETIEFGPYRGAAVERVEWLRRIAYLSDGTALRLPSDVGTHAGVQGTPAGGQAESQVPGALQRISPASREETPTPAVRTDANDVGVRYADEPIREVRQQPDRRLGGSSVLLRSTPGNGGSGQPAVVGSPGSGRTEGRGAIGSQTQYVLPRYASPRRSGSVSPSRTAYESTRVERGVVYPAQPRR